MAQDYYEKFKERLRAGAQAADPVDEERDTGLEVQGAEPDDEADDPIDEVDRPSRADKKRQRRGMIEELEATRASKAALEAELAAARAEKAALLIQSQQPRQQPGPNPAQAELDALFQEEETLLSAWHATNANMSAEEKARYKAKARDLETRKAVAHYRLAGGGQQVQQPIDQNAMINASLATVYPEVYQDQRALSAAGAHLTLLIARGQPDNIETRKQALELAREEFRRTASRRPSLEDRHRYTAAPRAGGPSAGEERTARRIEMTAEHQRMADAMFEGRKDPKTGRPFTAAQRAQMWVNKIGPKLLEKKRSA